MTIIDYYCSRMKVNETHLNSFTQTLFFKLKENRFRRVQCIYTDFTFDAVFNAALFVLHIIICLHMVV